MRINMSVAYELHGRYSTDLFTEESVRLIEKHDLTRPLFLYLAHAAVHSGNSYEPLRAPDEAIQAFEYIEDFKRRRFAGSCNQMFLKKKDKKKWNLQGC